MYVQILEIHNCDTSQFCVFWGPRLLLGTHSVYSKPQTSKLLSWSTTFMAPRIKLSRLLPIYRRDFSKRHFRPSSSCSFPRFHPQQTPQAFLPQCCHLLLLLELWSWWASLLRVLPTCPRICCHLRNQLGGVLNWWCPWWRSLGRCCQHNSEVQNVLAKWSFSEACLCSAFGVKALSKNPRSTDMPFRGLFCSLGCDPCSSHAPYLPLSARSLS